eukprot:scaffold870_cov268-Pinguiococcus_pyrenoidosus.AAC.97
MHRGRISSRPGSDPSTVRGFERPWTCPVCFPGAQGTDRQARAPEMALACKSRSRLGAETSTERPRRRRRRLCGRRAVVARGEYAKAACLVGGRSVGSKNLANLPVPNHR